MMTTGIPLAIAARPARPAPSKSSGASTIPSTPTATASCTSLICSPRSSSLSGPCQITSTSPCSSAAFRAPAWIDCQNSCVVPFGMTMTRHRLPSCRRVAAPCVCGTLGGLISGAISAESIFSGRDASSRPSRLRFSTGFFSR